MRNKRTWWGMLGMLVLLCGMLITQAQAIGVQWTAVKGTFDMNGAVQYPVYGTKGVADAANNPGGRYALASWVGNDGAIYIFGGASPTTTSLSSECYRNDLWKYDPSTNNWTWLNGDSEECSGGHYGTQGVPAADNSPCARIWSHAWTGSDGVFYLFGGQGWFYDELGNAYSGALRDLWKYDPTTNNWTRLKGDLDIDLQPIYGTLGIPDATNTPGGRYIGAGWIGSNDTLYFYGGAGYLAYNYTLQSNMGSIFSDLWKYDLATNNWTWIKGVNTLWQSAVYGTKGVAATANTPGAQQYSLSWTGSDGIFYLLDGNSYPNGFTNAFWKYDPSNSKWTWLKGVQTSFPLGTYGTKGVTAATNTPGARVAGASCVGIDGGLYLFGGNGCDSVNTGGNLLNDLWKYDATSNNWTWISGYKTGEQKGTCGTIGVPATTNVPGARFYPTLVSSGGGLYAFGGYGYDCGSATQSDYHLNELWRGIFQYTVAFQTDGTTGSSITGTKSQTIDRGANCTTVTANAPTGYHFVKWTKNNVDYSTSATLTVTNVTADMAFKAVFAINTYTLTYTAGPNGTISGANPQTVNYNTSGSAVTAVPDAGYHFANWSDGLTTSSIRTDTKVTTNKTVTANFATN